MSEQSATAEIIKTMLPTEVGGKRLSHEAQTQPVPVAPEQQFSQEQVAALTKTCQQKDQASLQGVRVQLKSEIEAEERRRDELQAWEMYSRNYQEHHGGKAPPGSDTEYGKGLFTTYVEQTYKPYKAAWKKAVAASEQLQQARQKAKLEGTDTTEAWQNWVKASDEMDRIENSRAYQEQQTYEFNKRRAASERERYGDYISSVFSRRSEKAASTAHRASQAPVRSGAATATAFSNVSRSSAESIGSRRSESTSSRGSSSSGESRGSGKA